MENLADYTIEIGGPGRCVNLPFSIIYDALIKAGYTVEVANDHPDKRPLEEQLDWAKQHAIGDIVKIKVKHYPWGG